MRVRIMGVGVYTAVAWAVVASIAAAEVTNAQYRVFNAGFRIVSAPPETVASNSIKEGVSK